MNEDIRATIGRRVLGHNRIIRLLAVGGMGRIYLGRTEGAAGFVMPVVIKQILPQMVGDDAMVKMFVREAQILATLQHPGIVAVHDFAVSGGEYLMAMEYVRGHAVSRWLRYRRRRGTPFPVDAGVQIALSVLEALHYAHTLVGPDGKRGAVIHRDVTPGNILVSGDGHVKLLDFGIARTPEDVTVPGARGPTIKGKFAYLAPEIFQGAEPTPVTDVYSLALTLHEILAGENELFAKDLPGTLARVKRHVPSRLDALRSDVPEALADAVMKQLSKDPAERFGSAMEFEAALRAVSAANPPEGRLVLARLASDDFTNANHDPDSGLDNLDDLDRAWRDANVTARVPRLQAGETTLPEHPTVLPATPTREPGRLRSLAGIVVVALTLCAAALAIAAQFRADRGGESVPFVVVGGQRAGGHDEVRPTIGDAGTQGAPSETHPAITAIATGASEATSPVALPSPALQAREASAAAGTARTAGRYDPAAVLTRRFSRERARVRRCVQTFAADVPIGSDEISIRFEVAASGQVTSASVAPAALGPTRFGQCVIDVAQSVAFGAQTQRLAFRIPIRVRRVPSGR